MFNSASLQVKDSDIRYTFRGRARATIPSFLEAPLGLGVLHPGLQGEALEVSLAELNSCRDSFAGQVPLLAGRQPCFG